MEFIYENTRMIKRSVISDLNRALDNQSAVALLGPRQTGKTTLARFIAKDRPAIYMDLESPADLLKLDQPLLFLSQHPNKLIILDEIQRKPDLFMVLRGLIDKRRTEGHKDARFLILGSANRDLLKQSSQSLAGRISYFELTGFNLLETKETKKLWLRGGFPESFLADSLRVSLHWREDFIRTYLERDIPQFGFRIPSERMRRLWTMLAHLQGQTLNASGLAGNLDLNSKTIKYYIDILTDLLLVRCLKPWHSNIKKRLVKAPRVYIRDSGLLHQLIGIHSYDQLISHPVVGAGWEGFVIENIISILPKGADAYFYRTQAGAEIDLIIRFSEKDLWAVEIKRGFSPKIQKGFYSACEDVKPAKKYIVYSGDDEFQIRDNITVLSLLKIMKHIQNL